MQYLKWSGRRYSISHTGEIIDNVNNKSLPICHDGKWGTVDLEWILGKRKYNIALLYVFTYYEITLPTYLWDQMSFVPKDDDFSNLTLENIDTIHTVPIEVEGYSGFYYIPTFSHYALSRDGRLLSLLTGKEKRWTISKGQGTRLAGYRYVRLYPKDIRSKNGTIFYRHRLLLTVFNRIDKWGVDWIVNHKNGIKGDDRLDNLEWVTYSENNKHARETGLVNNNRPVWSRDLTTGVVTHFNTLKEAAIAANIYPETLLNRATRLKHRRYNDNLQFKLDESAEWPVVDETKTYLSRNMNSVAVRDVFTGSVKIYQDVISASTSCGVASGTILRHIRDRVVIPICGYNFKTLSDKTPWPIHNDRLLAVYKDNPKHPRNGLIIKDLRSGKETFYTSVKKAASDLGWELNSLLQAANKADKRNVYKKHYQLTPFKLKEQIQCPANA